MTPAGTTPRNPVLAAAAALPRTGDRVFAARPDQVREARRFLSAILAGSPVADDAMLCVSELASNAVRHSNSSKAGGTFTVRVAAFDGHCVYIQVQDDGGRWQESARDRGRPHGLDIVRALAGDHGRDGDALTGWVVWARLDWPVAGIGDGQRAVQQAGRGDVPYLG
jgi:anti-sigma regulatory factor (Ser/Thr protein kinase)